MVETPNWNEANTPPYAEACILLVEDDEAIRLALEDTLTNLDCRVIAESTGERALLALEHCDVDVILTDVRMPGISGIDLCNYVAGERPGVPVVVMTAFGDVRTAVDALRAGAMDFITKPFALRTVTETLRRALTRARQNRDLVRLTPKPSTADSILRRFVGSSSAMDSLRTRLVNAACCDANVLLSGEIGTGKSLAARTLHDASSRAIAPFVTVNCCGVVHEALEVQLFGESSVARGSSRTGASQTGLFEATRLGTIFLDSVDEIPESLCFKLLGAVLESRRSSNAVTGDQPRKPRIIAAAKRSAQGGIAAPAATLEFLKQLCPLTVALPPLRARALDAIELGRHFVGLHSQLRRTVELSTAVEAALLKYDWPGNVSELARCMEFAVQMSTRDRISVNELPMALRSVATTECLQKAVSIQQVERDHITDVLRTCRWNKANTARALGIDRATLYRKLSRLGLSSIGPVRHSDDVSIEELAG